MDDEYPFTISYLSEFNKDGVWQIDIRLAFDGYFPPPPGSTLSRVSRVAVLQTIAREAERGRALGAIKVEVNMVGFDMAFPESIMLGDYIQ